MVNCWRSYFSFNFGICPGASDDFLSMSDMRRTLKVIHFASQLCGISPYGSFLRNDGYKKTYSLQKVFVVLLVSDYCHFCGPGTFCD